MENCINKGLKSAQHTYNIKYLCIKAYSGIQGFNGRILNYYERFKSKEKKVYTTICRIIKCIKAQMPYNTARFRTGEQFARQIHTQGVQITSKKNTCDN